VVDVDGKTVRQFRASGQPGLHRVAWDLSIGGDAGGGKGGGMGGGKGGGKGKGQAGKGAEEQPPPLGVPGFAGGRAAPPGSYRIVLNVDGREFSQVLRLEADPTGRGGLTAAEQEE